MKILTVLYPYRKHIAALLTILAAFACGFYRGRITAPVQVKTVAVESPVEHVVSQTKTVTDVRYVEKPSPSAPEVNIKVPKQELTVAVNGKEQVIKKSDSEKYVFDENQLRLEQNSKASLDITIPTVDKTRKWSIGIGASRNGAAYLVRAPLKGHVGLWAVGDKKTVMGGVTFDF